MAIKENNEVASTLSEAIQKNKGLRNHSISQIGRLKVGERVHTVLCTKEEGWLYLVCVKILKKNKEECSVEVLVREHKQRTSLSFDYPCLVNIL